MLAFLSNLGILKAMIIDVKAMVDNLEQLSLNWCIDVPAEKNTAKKIALALYGKIAVIYADEFISAAAHRWKTQINENSKAWAFYETLPELNHNAVVGYQFPVEIADKMFVVFLRTENSNKRTMIRCQITSDLLKENDIGFTVVDAPGNDDLSRLMSLIYLGDWISYYLAILYQIDPTPVKAIDYLKKKLSDFSD